MFNCNSITYSKGDSKKMIKFKNINFSYKDLNIYTNLNLTFEYNKSYAVIGKSGCGKSTLLRLIVGLEDTKSGQIIIDGQVVNSNNYVSPSKRKVALVFQDYALFPHLNVKKNIIYGLKTFTNFNEIVKELEIDHLLSKHPYQLSGGEQQRVAIARALIRNPKYLLLDEPFSNLDDETKAHSKELIKHLIKSSNMTVIMNTHSKEDYEGLIDEVVDLNRIKKNIC